MGRSVEGRSGPRRWAEEKGERPHESDGGRIEPSEDAPGDLARPPAEVERQRADFEDEPREEDADEGERGAEEGLAGQGEDAEEDGKVEDGPWQGRDEGETDKKVAREDPARVDGVTSQERDDDWRGEVWGGGERVSAGERQMADGVGKKGAKGTHRVRRQR